MAGMMRRWIAHPGLALGSTVLWGFIEWLALLRSRLDDPGVPSPSPRRPRNSRNADGQTASLLR